MLRLSAIGDVCHTLPVVRTLQARLPDTAITWIIGKTEASLVGDITGIEFITFDKRDGLAGMRALRRRLAGRRFDVLLHMQAALRASFLSRAVPARARVGFDRARARDFQWLFTNARIAPAERQHVMDGLFGFAEALGVHERILRWDIPLTDGDLAFADATLGGGRALLISPCSSARFRNYRNWPAERYAAVAAHAARAHGMKVIVTGGPTALEREYGAAIARAAGVPVTDLTGRTTLKQLYALISGATAVLCPDSGPAHMATAAGTPVIGLYASSNPDRTGPYLAREWTVNRYPEALLEECGKTVEQARWGKRVRAPDAMARITVEEVIGKLDAVINLQG